MFHSAALKLTAWYLGIIMLVSIVFSLALYHVEGHDLDRNINRQVSYYTGFLSPFDLNNYSQIRQNQLDQDRAHMRANLIALNLLVLIAGGAASYALARRTLEPIEVALEAQKRFAADASHELRTPLTAMQSEIEVALRDPKLSKTEAIALLGSNLEEVAKLKDLSEGLLKLANQNGRLHTNNSIELSDLIQEAIARMSRSAEAKGIMLEQKLKPATIKGDAASLVELAVIFIDNAIKYSPSASKVMISNGIMRKQIFLRVKDHGQGIKPEDLPRIFERFYRADHSRNKDQADGYGLGLALAKKIVDVHGGHIEVQSSIGKGSTFTAFLPSA